MKRDEREYIRLAEAEGIERPRIVWGQPHGRLLGTVDGKEICLVVSLSKGAFRHPRRTMMTKSNFRKAVREARGI